MAGTFEELQAMTKEQLIALYNRKSPSVQTGLGFVRDEIARREADELNGRMLALTKQMRDMTTAISVLTVANVVATGVSVFLALT